MGSWRCLLSNLQQTPGPSSPSGSNTSLIQSFNIIRDNAVDRRWVLRYHAGMESESDMHTLARQMAVMEERMKSMKADYESALDRLRADMALHREDGAKRETRMLLAMAGMIGLAVAILGILISLPA
ncbi:MAG: hypothetical protein OXC91_12035 [Rhodobacteraceae bacterium]|nr:hypothetical protein [Paracoccaceae bacterium]